MLLLAACGGGGGGGAQVASTASFNLQQVWTNDFNSEQSKVLPVTGTVTQGSQTYTVTGISTVGADKPVASSFEGQSALKRNRMFDLKLVVSGQTLNTTTVISEWASTSYQPLGESSTSDGVSAGYIVIRGVASLPTAVRVGDTGIIYTADIYASSAKHYSMGTLEFSYKVEADTANTVLLTFTRTYNSVFAFSTESYATQMIVDISGAITYVKHTDVYNNFASGLTMSLDLNY